MPIYCFVPGCTTTGTNGFHRFPTDPQLRKEWSTKTKTNPTNNSKICRKHFIDHELIVDIDGKKRLVPNAVPSLFLPTTMPIEPVSTVALSLPTVSLPLQTVPLVLNWDHNYHSISSLKKRRYKRLKISKQEPEISDDNIGNEVVLGASRIEDDQVNVGSYISTEYLRSLEEKILQQSKEKIELARRLRNTTRQLKRLQRKSKSKLDDKKVLEYLRDKKKYGSTQLQFEEMQLRNASRKPHGRRYKLEEKSMCLAMYKSGPRAYRFKENNKIMVLPSLSTLSRHCAKLMFRVGISTALFSFIKEKVKDWSEIDLLCSLSFDETALKSRLEYCTTEDEIIGFVELYDIRRPVFATHALTFMVRGIHRPFKQPVAYFYTHSLKAFELAEILVLVIEAVLSTGLNVIMSVCDQLRTNESTIHRLMDRDFQRTPGCLLQYKVSGKTIIHCYDAPHLIKVVRNNLEVKNFKHSIIERWTTKTSKTYGKEQTASWDDVQRLFEHDRNGCPRSLLKISYEHMKPTKLKMSVSVATQVFSQTYGTLMIDSAKNKLIKEIPETSIGTGQMLLFINDLFDSFNGSGPAKRGSLKGSININSPHFEFWEWALFMLAKMSYIDKTTGKTNCRSTVINKIESTIRGYQEVTRICLSKNMEEVSLRNTDSDGLENFFGCVKFCCQISCSMTPRQYRSGYTTMNLNNLMSSKSLSSNCEPDGSVALLTDVHDLISNYISSSTEAQPDDILSISNVLFDYEYQKEELNFFESHSLTQAANLIRSKILHKCYCGYCKHQLETNIEEQPISHTHFIPLFKKIFNFAIQTIPFFASDKNIKNSVVEEIKKNFVEEEQLMMIGCVEHNGEIITKIFDLTTFYALNLFCKNINDLLTGKIKALPEKYFEIQELAHKFWVKKTAHIGKHSDKFKK